MRWWWLALAIGCGAQPGRPEANLVFVTSSVQTANLGGFEGGDAICRDRAREAGLEGTYVAWLSTTGRSAFDRLRGSRGWVLVDGTPVVDTISDLVTGNMLSPIFRDERGRDIRATQFGVWTGTIADGTLGGACGDWNVDTTGAGTNGYATRGGAYFTDSEVTTCKSPRRLYCFETGRDVAVTPEQHDGRFAFVSAATWRPNAGGVPSADAVCQGEATAAGLPGTYLALLGTGQSPAARFDLTGKPWQRRDGVQLAPTATALFDAGFLTSYIDRTADGSLIGSVFFWGGEPRLASSSMYCSSWTQPNPVESVVTGVPHTTEHQQFFLGAGRACDAPNIRLLCLQQ